MVEDEVQVVNAQAGGKAFISQHVGDELVLLMLENADFFFHGILRQEAVGNHLVFLADAVRTVDGLAFYGRVPPRVIQNDIGGGSKVEAAPPAFRESRKTEGSLVVWNFSISPRRSLVWPVR